jgi:hypothetical protein
LDPALDVGYGTLRDPFVPVPVQRLGGDAELDDEIVAEIHGSAAPRYAGGLEALSHNLKMLWTSDPNRAQAVR